MANMLTVEEAQERILAHFQRLPAEDVPLPEALGRVLAEDAHARENMPPFANSAMDGYALRAADSSGATASVPAALRLVGEVAAGRVYAGTLGQGEAVRIFTGAPVPDGADAVIQQEVVRVEGQNLLLDAPVARGNNIRAAGEDASVGVVLVRAGTEIGPAEIALLASAGAHPVRVTRRPTVAILATGDELAPLGQPLGPGQIRESNSPYLAAAVTRAGALPLPLGVARDREEELRAKLKEAQAADLILSSGGVSVGDYDLVKQILAEEGAMDFWRVAMRPGKPLAFGHIGTTPLLGLPGNPVSSAVTFELFGRPALRRMLGVRSIFRPRVLALLDGEDIRQGDRRHYVRARLETRGTTLVAHTTGAQGSHMITSLRGATAYLVVEVGDGIIHAGEAVPALLLNDALPWGEG